MINNIPVSALILGLILDSILGDPYGLPHPIRFFGRIIAFGEKLLNRGPNRLLKGAALVLFCLLSLFFALLFLMKLITSLPYVALLVSSVFVFYGVANHSLIRESLKVERILQKAPISEARKALSMIVGRDTSTLDEHQIRKAILETLAENLSDGVIAPLFFYAIAGVPGIMTYKMANTFDSMIGYKTERYKDFGFFAAKLDDLLNFIPARITALIMVILTFSFRGFTFILRFGRKHASPNAGYPEAALAGILNVRFGGPNYYHGELLNKPFIGLHDRPLEHIDVIKTCVLNIMVTVVFSLLVLSCL